VADAHAGSRISTETRDLPLAGKGPLRCGSCGYEIVSYRALPPCPMCRDFRWESTRWRPFSRLYAQAHSSRENP
jgi:hypothetical protein